MKHIYQRILKNGDGGHKYLRCPYLRDSDFDILCPDIALDKVEQTCGKTVKAKPNEKYSGFITYSNRVYFYCIWLDKYVYLMPNVIILKKRLSRGSKNWGEQK